MRLSKLRQNDGTIDVIGKAFWHMKVNLSRNHWSVQTWQRESVPKRGETMRFSFQQDMVRPYNCLWPKAIDLGFTWVVVLGFFVWSMLYQIPSHFYLPMSTYQHQPTYIYLSLYNRLRSRSRLGLVKNTWCPAIASKSCSLNGKTGKLFLVSSIFWCFFSYSVNGFFGLRSFTLPEPESSLPESLSSFSSFVPGILRAWIWKKIRNNIALQSEVVSFCYIIVDSSGQRLWHLG